VVDTTSPSLALAQPWPPSTPLSWPKNHQHPLSRAKTIALKRTRMPRWQGHDGTEPRSTRHQPRLPRTASTPSPC
jgi:hypothetical protein